MKEKSEILREHLKRNMMKNIIFRIDYQGIIDSDDIVKEFNKKFKGLFKNLTTTFHNKVDFELNNIDDISDTLSIPVKEIEKQEIHRYSKNTFGNDELVFDISKYFTVLTVNCSEYQGIQDYLEFFADYICFLYEQCEYLKIKRAGLRKIGGQVFTSRDQIFESFEQTYFNFDFTDSEYNSIRNRYVDVLQKDDNSPVINYIRSFETGILRDNETGEDKEAFQVLLDLDGYYPEEILNLIEFGPDKAKSTLEVTNHVHLFDLFKMSVTQNFLNLNIDE